MAQIGIGTKVSLSTNGTSFTDIAELLDVTPPASTIDTVDSTHMGSANATREFILGLRDPGETSFEIAFDPGSATDTLIQTTRDARKEVTVKITFPNESTWTFKGILTSYEPAVPLDDRMTATVTFKVSGSVVAAKKV